MTKQQRDALIEVKQALEAQAPEGAAPDPFAQEQRDDHADGEPAPATGDDDDG